MQQRMLRAACVMALSLCLSPAAAQTVADVRAEVSVLNGQVQQLRDQLVRQGAAGGLAGEPATALEVLDRLEGKLRVLTDRVDVLSNDVDRIVRDASNRVGDIEFRLTELEGGEPLAVEGGELLGGGVTRPKPRTDTGTLSVPGAQLTITEQSDFDTAASAAAAGEHSRAVALFDAFIATWPDGPLSSEARLRRSQSLAETGDLQSAAQGFLDTFSADPAGKHSAASLLGLGNALAGLGQTGEACLTLAEVGIRHAASPEAKQAGERRIALNCPS